MDIVIAEPVINSDINSDINIKYNEDPTLIEISIKHLGFNYVSYITDKEIPITRFDLKTFYKLLEDILINKKENSDFNSNFKEEKCFLHCSMILSDYLKTEYKFVLVLKPTDKITETKILNYQIMELKKEVKILQIDNKELKDTVNNLKKLKVKDFYGMPRDLVVDYISRFRINHPLNHLFIYILSNIRSDYRPIFSNLEGDVEKVYSINLITYSNKNEINSFIKNDLVNFLVNKFLNISIDDLANHGLIFLNKYKSNEPLFRPNQNDYTKGATFIFYKYLDDTIKF